jgi:hypothetical protein
MTYQIQCLPMGIGEVPGPELFWMSDWDQWYPLAFQIVLIRGDGVVALVNTGPALDLAPMNDRWASFLGDRARFVRQPGEFILDQLASVGVTPEDVTHIVLTPLQLYTVSNILAFPHARIHISRRGWTHFHTTWSHPHDDRDTSIPPAILAELVGSAWDRVVLLEDEHEIAPGFRTWWAGGHHRATIAIEVDTGNPHVGTVVISDAFFYSENVERDHPIGISENIYESLAAYRRARDTGVVVPLYDPKNQTRFPGGVIS